MGEIHVTIGCGARGAPDGSAGLVASTVRETSTGGCAPDGRSTAEVSAAPGGGVVMVTMDMAFSSGTSVLRGGSDQWNVFHVISYGKSCQSLLCEIGRTVTTPQSLATGVTTVPMSSETPAPISGADVERAIALLSEARSVVVLSGAGMSTASGIPDFRGPQGVWTKNPEAEKLATISHYLADPEVRQRSWQSRLHHPAWTSTANDGHRALVELERSGRLRLLVTQNVDGLHQLAGSSPDLVVEIHGTMRETECLSCHRREPMPDTLERVRSGEVDPPCLVCGGILKSATISFGQSLVEADLERSFAAAGSRRWRVPRSI